MRGFVLIFIVVALLLGPLVIFTYRNPILSKYLQNFYKSSRSTQLSKQVTVVNTSKNSSLKLVDTAYIEFQAAKMGILKENAIVDPQLYFGNKGSTDKYTVKRIQFILVDDMDFMVYGTPGRKSFISKGNYKIVDDVLEVFVSINTSEISSNSLNRQFQIEEVFLNTVFTTLMYARGLSSPQDTAEVIDQIQSDMKQYLESGVFAWPIEISTI